MTDISDKDLIFIASHKGNSVEQKDRDLAIEMITERIMRGNKELLQSFDQEGSIPQPIKNKVFEKYYTTFPVFEMDWDGLTGLLLAEDKRSIIRMYAAGGNLERISPGIVAAQVKFAIDAIPSSYYCLTSFMKDPLENRRGKSVAHSWFSNMKEAENKVWGNLPNLSDAQLKELKEKHKLVVTGKDGKKYFLKYHPDEVFIYKNESILPREAEEAFLHKFIKEIIRERGGIYEVLTLAGKHVDYEMWHREIAWNAVLENVSRHDMHALYEVIERTHSKDNWEIDYPKDWAQPAKGKLKELQESYLKEARESSDALGTLTSIYHHAQTAEIKADAYGKIKLAYAALLESKISEGENIEYQCNGMEDVPVEIRNSIGRPRLNESYRAQIENAKADPQIYWQLERMRDAGTNYEKTPQVIRIEAGKALEQVVKATVEGMRQVKAEAEKPKPEPVAAIVEDKKATVVELGKNISKQPSKYWVPRAFNATVAAIRKL
jgi:hypothetical protein